MRRLLYVFIILTFSITLLFANTNKIVGFDIGLASGLPVYSSDSISDSNSLINDGDYNRIIFGGLFDLSFSICEPLKIIMGSDILCDFIWSGSDYSNHLDYAFWGGIKFYPGVGGLNGSLAYALGRRTDFFNNEVEDTTISSSAWGNGFRVGIEYDFKYQSEHSCMPALGIYYRFMPRGNNTYDNIFAVYCSLVR